MNNGPDGSGNNRMPAFFANKNQRQERNRGQEPPYNNFPENMSNSSSTLFNKIIFYFTLNKYVVF